MSESLVEPAVTPVPAVTLSATPAPDTGIDRWSLFAVALAALCCCSAIAIVYTTHLSRSVWADISSSRSLIDELNVEWGRLQIEESTFSDHGRIERAAVERLGMSHPSLEDTQFIVSGEVRR